MYREIAIKGTHNNNIFPESRRIPIMEKNTSMLFHAFSLVR